MGSVANVLACGGGIALTRSDAVEGRAKQVSAQEVIREGGFDDMRLRRQQIEEIEARKSTPDRY